LNSKTYKAVIPAQAKMTAFSLVMQLYHEKPMLTRDINAFFNYANACAPEFPACAKAAFLVSPEKFSLADESAQDNVYMAMQQQVNGDIALKQHQQLAQALSKQLPTITFAGRAETPDAVFPNNVFATANKKVILGHMRHEVRQAEAERKDILDFFREAMNYSLLDLRTQPGICELTGSLIIDRARNIGFCGLSERCDETGAQAMAGAFGLKACLLFDLAPGEYHSNVVLSVLASRAVIIAPSGFADKAVSDAVTRFYAPNAVVLSREEKNAFAANAIALTEDAVWMSRVAANKLSPVNHHALKNAGFAVNAVDLSEIEKAGGSLRCCVGEIF
jgi:hypothetical protein